VQTLSIRHGCASAGVRLAHSASKAQSDSHADSVVSKFQSAVGNRQSQKPIAAVGADAARKLAICCASVMEASTDARPDIIIIITNKLLGNTCT